MRKPTEMEWRCAHAACCGQEIGTGGKCKRDPEVCDAVDYLNHVRLIIRAMRGPTRDVLDAGYAHQRTMNGAMSAATTFAIMIDAASPPESE